MNPLVLKGGEVLDPSRRVDYVVPYPYGSNIGVSSSGVLEPRLSVLSRMSIDAAVKIFERHQMARILIAGETPYGSRGYGEVLPNTTDLMMLRAGENAAVGEASLVPLVGLSGLGNNNTNLQTETVADFLTSTNARGRVLVVTLGYHLRRVAQTMGLYGLEPHFVTAESVLNAAGITSYDRYLPSIAGLEESERKIRFLNRLDRKGRLLRLAMRVKGARLVDVEEDENGVVKLEQGYAREKMRMVRENASSLK